MRFGKSRDPALDINHQLGLFMNMARNRPRTACDAGAAAARCRACRRCLPLFPKLLKGADNTYTIHPDPVPSPAQVSAMVVAALRLIGVDTTDFSGVCCRMGREMMMGGLTVATEAGVPENILWMQSGHA